MKRLDFIVWRKIGGYDEEKDGNTVLLKCLKYGVYVGWKNEDGWTNCEWGDQYEYDVVDVEPIYYARMPKP